MRDKCPKEVITVVGGATLTVNGEFKLACLGKTCADYPVCTELAKEGAYD